MLCHISVDESASYQAYRLARVLRSHVVSLLLDDELMPTKPPVAPKAPLALYANYFEIGHNRFEFLIDFGQFHPETDKVALHTRIALGPSHAKLLWQLLSDAVRAYENKCGEIASVGKTGDALAAVLRTLPDFERRAVAARQRALSGKAANPASNRGSKR